MWMKEDQYIQAIINEAEKKGNVYEIVLEIGELSTIDRRVLQRELLRQKRWTVLTFESEGKVGCLCGYSGRPKILRKTQDSIDYTCPKCNKPPTIL